MGRHLRNEDRIQLITTLRSSNDVNQSVEINSASNCDECEEYAQELREAIGSIPGWRASGGTTIFGSAATRGIRFLVFSLEKRPNEFIKLAAAFDAAQIRFEWIEDKTLSGYNYILVARQVRR